MDNDQLMLQFQKKLDELCSSVGSISAKMENVLSNTKKLNAFDERLRQIETEFSSFKTRVTYYGIIGAFIISLLVKSLNFHF